MNQKYIYIIYNQKLMLEPIFFLREAGYRIKEVHLPALQPAF